MSLALTFAAISTLSTFTGGIFVLRFQKRLRLILSYSAGALLGVCFFDLLPSARAFLNENWKGPVYGMACAAGFLLYLLLRQVIRLSQSQGPRSGDLNALSLVMHSVLDGISIGLAFKASNPIGIAVAAAVITHDFSDGINTVSVVMRSRSKTSRALSWLVLDALAPLLGVGLASLLQIPHALLGAALAGVAGCLLSITTIDLLPESLLPPSRAWPTLAILIGALTLYFVVRIGGPL
jgi:ZIP family zinc transporter